jgi:DNA-binding PadR family transcriptional regulator
MVLRSVADGRRYGFDIMDSTGLPSGTVYPALRRLEDSGLIRSQGEKEREALEEGRPARKYYKLTRAGETSLAEAAERFRMPRAET